MSMRRAWIIRGSFGRACDPEAVLGGSAAVSLALLLCAATGFADTNEEPLGLVLSATGSKLLRSDTETPLTALPGDLLFAGDGLRTETGPASFLFCPGKALDTLTPSGEIRLDAKAPKVRAGKITEQPVHDCTLPKTLRVAAASQQHYGLSMVRGDGPDFRPLPREQLSPELLAELGSTDAALDKDPKDPGALIASAIIFENHKIYANALERYEKLQQLWPDAAWVKSKIFDLRTELAEQRAGQNVEANAPGKIFALLVGVSKYLNTDINLKFADADADDFGKLLETPRAGGVPTENISLLTNEKATKAAIQMGFDDFLRHKAGKADTVVILIAAHGVVETRGDKRAYLLPYDANAQNLQSTALSVSDLQQLFQTQLQRVGRVVMFLDVCKAGSVGAITGKNTINAHLEDQLGDSEGSLTGVLASGKTEFSFEGPEFGGGHGAFSYFVMKGLAGAADKNGDGAVDARELFDFVYTNVEEATANRQHPSTIGNFENELRLADLKKPGTQISHWRILHDYRHGGPLYLSFGGQTAPNTEVQRDVENFSSAIRAGRLRSDEGGNALDALEKLRTELGPEDLFERENDLRVALDDRTQRILLRYIAGEQNPQTRQDFDLGSRYVSVARRLTPESLLLEARADFFQGRTLLFDKNFPQATSLLEQAVRIDPGSGYAYNALGIGYLEQADYNSAIRAFHDATRLAPYWAYPLHNLALTYTQLGDYGAAVRAYRQAMDLAPRYAYLPYNLGLLYQRINKRKEAENAYVRAIQLAPDLAEPYNALGYLRESQKRSREAEEFYDQALQKNPDLLAARQNLAVMLFKQRDRGDEAVGLWRLNIAKQPEYLPSRLSLAKALSALGRVDDAIGEYNAAIAARPDYMGARLALADLYQQKPDLASALFQLQTVLNRQPSNSVALEQFGDVEGRLGQPSQALDAYNKALLNATDGALRKRIRSKIKMLRR